MASKQTLEHKKSSTSNGGLPIIFPTLQPSSAEKDYLLSPRPENPRRTMQWYTNMFLINFVEFSSESSRGIILATLFLYSKSLGGNIAFMGLLTSVFSVGRFLSSMLFGWMCDRYTFRTVYIWSSLICLFGNVLYLVADEHLAHSKMLLAFSRFVVGFGAGNRSVCRANVAFMTSVDQRLKYLTILALVVFLGYALTPGLGSLVSKVNVWCLGLHVNKFTAPGAILIFLNAITIFAVVFFFDSSVGRNDAPPDSAGSLQKQTMDVTSLPDEIVRIGVGVFIFLNFNARGILAVFETINIPLFLQVTGHDPSSHVAVEKASSFQFSLGCLGLVSYFAIEIFRHRISDKNWLCMGFAALVVGNVLLSIEPSALSFNRLAVSECFIWSIGCPITTAVVVATFSKILGGKPQGTMMGLLGSTGSLSRMILPLLPSLFTSYTPLFIINTLLCVSGLVALIWYDHIVRAVRRKTKTTLLSPKSPMHMQPADCTEG